MWKFCNVTFHNSILAKSREIFHFFSIFFQKPHKKWVLLGDCTNYVSIRILVKMGLLSLVRQVQ